MGIPITMTDLRFMRFSANELFPGGSVPGDDDRTGLSTEAGFPVEQKQLLDEHYVRTLDTWAEALEAHHDEAVAATSEEVYQQYIKYLTGCSDLFNQGLGHIRQFIRGPACPDERLRRDRAPCPRYCRRSPRPSIPPPSPSLPGGHRPLRHRASSGHGSNQSIVQQFTSAGNMQIYETTN